MSLLLRPICAVPDAHTPVFVMAAFPGEGGVSGAGSGQREAAAGGDAHGQGGGHAQRPPPPGPGELHHRPAGCAPAGRHPFTPPGTADVGVGTWGPKAVRKASGEMPEAPLFTGSTSACFILKVKGSQGHLYTIDTPLPGGVTQASQGVTVQDLI